MPAALVFDTRPDAGPDGEWTLHIVGNELDRPQWLAADEANANWPVSVVLLDGSVRKLPLGSHSELARLLGELLKSVLLEAREDGQFVSLARTPRCELLIEEFNGSFGWPRYADRGNENLVQL